jgi:SAM-dependent methyltransferase
MKLVLICGVHRSGTSLVARLLQAMGANLGSKIDVSPVTSNPFGHWEHDEIWRIQERLLIELGPGEFEAYLLEIGRILKPGGTAVIHHADRSPGARFRFLKKETESGWRSPVDRRDVRRWAQAAGLDVVVQENRWRSPKPSGVPRFGDCISVLQKRPSAF